MNFSDAWVELRDQVTGEAWKQATSPSDSSSIGALPPAYPTTNPTYAPASGIMALPMPVLIIGAIIVVLLLKRFIK